MAREHELVTLASDHDRLAELTGLAVNLDAVVEVLLEPGGVEDVVRRGDGEVDEELVRGLAGGLSGSGLGLEGQERAWSACGRRQCSIARTIVSTGYVLQNGAFVG